MQLLEGVAALDTGYRRGWLRDGTRVRGPVRDSRPSQVRIGNQAGQGDLAPRLPHPRSPGEPLQGARAAGPVGARTPGHHGRFPGAVFSRTLTGSTCVVAEVGAFLEQLVPREAGPAKMIQAILVFNNHGKPRLVRFYQRFVSAARPVTHPRPFPSPRLEAALAHTSGSSTVHDPPPLVFSTLPGSRLSCAS